MAAGQGAIGEQQERGRTGPDLGDVEELPGLAPDERRIVARDGGLEQPVDVGRWQAAVEIGQDLARQGKELVETGPTPVEAESVGRQAAQPSSSSSYLSFLPLVAKLREIVL